MKKAIVKAIVKKITITNKITFLAFFFLFLDLNLGIGKIDIII
jgi:hypothetical protein